jgi:hypothetical protein
LDEECIQQYQSLIGSMQWAISIGCFDIAVHVMSMSTFRTSPWCGHLDRAKCMVGYLSKFRLAKIWVLTNKLDYSDVERIEYDWTKSVYGDISEIIPKDTPTLTHYQDANLYNDIIAGCSITGILHFMNKMPIDWFSKKQATIEMATYRSEFISVKPASTRLLIYVSP